jgi:hypothetical protein
LAVTNSLGVSYYNLVANEQCAQYSLASLS